VTAIRLVGLQSVGEPVFLVEMEHWRKWLTRGVSGYVCAAPEAAAVLKDVLIWPEAEA
jgi:hypothetical protein